MKKILLLFMCSSLFIFGGEYQKVQKKMKQINVYYESKINEWHDMYSFDGVADQIDKYSTNLKKDELKRIYGLYVKKVSSLEKNKIDSEIRGINKRAQKEVEGLGGGAAEIAEIIAIGDEYERIALKIAKKYDALYNKK